MVLRLIHRSALGNWIRQERQHRAAVRFYGSLIRSGTLVFDVGANMGNRARAFRALGARVVAVEPQPKCVAELERRFGRDANVTILQAALGETDGHATMHIASYHTLSSMSEDWIDRVQESGRFSHYSWDKTEIVPVTTMDALIETHGIPEFTKIDVEGYELHVLRGLSKPVPLLSFEFTPETIENTSQCIQLLSGVGEYNFAFTTGEPSGLPNDWVDGEALSRSLEQYVGDTRTFGDVYAKHLAMSRFS